MNSHERAIQIADNASATAHKGQYRKNGTDPYIIHPRRVAKRVKSFGGNYIGIIAALLHDIIEDCKNGKQIVINTLHQTGLPKRDCDEILEIVVALTKNPSIRDKTKKQSDSMNRILHAPPQATLIKICDRIDNLIDSDGQSQQFLSVYLPLTDQLINELSANAVKCGYTHALDTLKTMRNRIKSS